MTTRAELSDLIAASGISQAEAARRADISPVVLNRYLRGQRATITVATLERIAAALSHRLTFAAPAAPSGHAATRGAG